MNDLPNQTEVEAIAVKIIEGFKLEGKEVLVTAAGRSVPTATSAVMILFMHVYLDGPGRSRPLCLDGGAGPLYSRGLERLGDSDESRREFLDKPSAEP